MPRGPACNIRFAPSGAVQAFMAHLDDITLADLIPHQPAFAAALGLPLAE